MGPMVFLNGLPEDRRALLGIVRVVACENQALYSRAIEQMGDFPVCVESGLHPTFRDVGACGPHNPI